MPFANRPEPRTLGLLPRVTQVFASTGSVFDKVLDMIDCTYELRIYAPVGGVNGNIEYIDDVGSESRVLEGKSLPVWLVVEIVAVADSWFFIRVSPQL